MGAAGSAARADAAARAGVFVRAPAKAPATVPEESPRARPSPTARAATRAKEPATTSIVGHPFRSEVKKWVPDTTPTVYVKRISPKVPTTSGISRSTPAAAAQAETPSAAKRTAAGPRCTPATRTCPTAAPSARSTARRRSGWSCSGKLSGRAAWAHPLHALSDVGPARGAGSPTSAALTSPLAERASYGGLRATVNDAESVVATTFTARTLKNQACRAMLPVVYVVALPEGRGLAGDRREGARRAPLDDVARLVGTSPRCRVTRSLDPERTAVPVAITGCPGASTGTVTVLDCADVPATFDGLHPVVVRVAERHRVVDHRDGAGVGPSGRSCDLGERPSVRRPLDHEPVSLVALSRQVRRNPRRAGLQRGGELARRGRARSPRASGRRRLRRDARERAAVADGVHRDDPVQVRRRRVRVESSVSERVPWVFAMVQR